MLSREEFEIKFMELYEKGLSTTEICKQLQENRDRGYKLIRKKGLKSSAIRNSVYTKEFLENLKQEYLQGATIEQLSDKYNVKQGGINFHLRKMGITRRNGKQTHFNENYFENIDTPQKAYFLGLLMADGCLHHCKEKGNSYSLRLELKIEDKYIIEKLKEELNSSNQVLIAEKKRKDAPSTYNAYFSVFSVKMAQDLIKLGMTPLKETHTKIPNINKELKRYFLLGYYDGDGVACATEKVHYMGFVGRLEILTDIVNTIEELAEIKAPKIYYNKSSHIYFAYYTKELEKSLYNFFYKDLNDSIAHLKRKEDKMFKAIF